MVVFVYLKRYLLYMFFRYLRNELYIQLYVVGLGDGV